MDRKNSLIKNTAILSIGTFSTKILTFIMVPFFSKWLSTSDYGEFDLLYTYINLLIPFVTLASGEAIFRKLINETEIKQKRITSTSFLIYLIATISTSIMLFLLYSIFNINIRFSFIILVLSEIINNFLMYYSRGKKKLINYSIAGIIYIIVMIIFIYYFVKVLNLGLNGMLLGYSLGFIFSSIYLFFSTMAYKDISLRFIDKKSFKEILSYSVPLMPNSVSWWITNVSDRTIVNIVLGSTFNGIYAIANKIPAICTTLFSVFHLSWQENASESIKDKNYGVYFNNVYNKVVVIISVICASVLSVTPYIFKYVLDYKYIEAYKHVPILVLAIYISFIGQFYGSIFIAMEKTKYNGSTTILAATVNLIVNIGLIRFIGLYAASISTLVSYIVLVLVRRIYLSKLIKLEFKKSNLLYVIFFCVVIICNYLNSKVFNFIILIFSLNIFLYTFKNIFLKIIKKFRR